MDRKIYWIIIIILLFICMYQYNNKPNIIEKIKIETKIDTLTFFKPIHDTIYLNKYITDTLKLKGDTIYKKAVIPLYTTVYKDSTYEAQISGYKANLDYIKVYPRETIIYKEKLVKSSKKRFNWGLQLGVGYGLINRKPDVYVGLGGQINF